VIRVRLDPRTPAPADLDYAAGAILRGELVVIPTDTLYGIAADPFDARAVRRVFDVKGRAAGQPLPLIGFDSVQVFEQIGRFPDAGVRLASAFWPGPLTLVVKAPDALTDEVTAGTGTIGVRVPDHAVARGLCRAAGKVLTATSANLSGRPPSADPDDAVADLSDRVAVLLDAGRTPGGPPSTVVDVTQAAARLVRAGAIAWEEIERCLRAG